LDKDYEEGAESGEDWVVHEYLESASPNTVRKKQRELFWEVVASASATPTASACPPSFLPDDRPPKVTGDPALISYSYSSPSFDGDDDDDDVPVVEAVLVDGEGRAWVAAALDADAAEADLIKAGMTVLPFLPQVVVGPCSPGTVLVIATPAGEGANNLFEGANDDGVIGGRWQWWWRRDLGLSFAVAVAIAVAMAAVTLALALALSLAKAGGCESSGGATMGTGGPARGGGGGGGRGDAAHPARPYVRATMQTPPPVASALVGSPSTRRIDNIMITQVVIDAGCAEQSTKSTGA